MRLKMKTTATLLIAIFMISAFAIVMPVSAATPTINGVIGSGEWDGALSITVDGGKGTVKILATTAADYLYVLFDLADPNDARTQYVNEVGNDQISINVNPTDGDTWGFPYDLIFETSALSGGVNGPDDGGHHWLPWNPKDNSGILDGWATRWFPNDAQDTLPGDALSATMYSGGKRITEWRIPLASIGVSPGDVLQLGGAVDIGDGNSYVYPIGMDWNTASTFAVYTLPLPPTLYWFKASGGGVSISDVSPTSGNFITLGVMGISLEPASYDEELVPCKGSGTLVDHTLKIKLSFDIVEGHIKRSGEMIWFYGTAKIFDITEHEKYYDIPFRLALVDDQHDPPNRFDVETYGDFPMHWHGDLEPGSEVTVWVWE